MCIFEENGARWDSLDAICRTSWLLEDNNNNKEAIILALNEEGYIRIHFQLSKVTISEGRASTSYKIVVSFTHSILEEGSNLHEFYNKFTYDSKAAWFNHVYTGQDIKGN